MISSKVESKFALIFFKSTCYFVIKHFDPLTPLKRLPSKHYSFSKVSFYFITGSKDQGDLRIGKETLLAV